MAPGEVPAAVLPVRRGPWGAAAGRGAARFDRGWLLVLGGSVVAVVGVYVVVVLGLGALLHRTSSPDLALSVLATALVALGLDPLRARLRDTATRRWADERRSPYAVLTRCSHPVGGARSHQDVAAGMARVLAEGTGAQWAQVWLGAPGRTVLAGAWPPDEGDTVQPDEQRPTMPGVRSLPVLLGEEVLGVLRLREREQLSAVEERLFADLAARAGLVFHKSRLCSDLGRRLEALTDRAHELRQSRARVVDAQDDSRRRLERDIHDGAQQHLVALAVNLRLARTLAGRSPERARAVLLAQAGAAHDAVDALLELSRGIYPRVLHERGPGAALRDVAARSPTPVEVVVQGLSRYRTDLEAAIYFCGVEALQNATKHAPGSTVVVRLLAGAALLELSVQDDGPGFDPAEPSPGTGLSGTRDRIDAVGGHLDVTSGPGGTTVRASVPAVPLPSRGAR